jgi:hypothetical protein
MVVLPPTANHPWKQRYEGMKVWRPVEPGLEEAEIAPVARSQTRKVSSPPAETARRPSGVRFTLGTIPVCHFMMSLKST